MSVRRRRSVRGFTIVEVLIAVVVSAIGFAAIFSLQIGTMQANVSAREMAASATLAERYIEVLRRDSFDWVNGLRPGEFLNAQPRRWHTFTPAPVDHNGRAFITDDEDFGSPLARQRFCVHYWLATEQGTYDGLLTARVRVVWPHSTLDRSGLAEVCSADGADGFREDVSKWFTLTVPASIRSGD
jgi:prepilin-type N-terminal cleavage/methylation domain-containing protein